jgi:hypothetical protein
VDAKNQTKIYPEFMSFDKVEVRVFSGPDQVQVGSNTEPDLIVMNIGPKGDPGAAGPNSVTSATTSDGTANLDLASLEIYPNGSISLASTNSGGVVILSGQAATDARSIAFPDASGNLALVASTTGAIVSADITDATSDGDANKEKLLKTDDQGGLFVTNSFGINASFGSSLTVGDGDSVKGRYDIFANTSHFQWYSDSALYGERSFTITTENLTSSGTWVYKYPAASGTFAVTASTTGVPDKLTDGTIAGSTTFNSTSYTYGTGAAAAHRDSLGLTTLATTTPAINVATFLATPTSTNLAAAVTGETGSGALVFGTSPTIDAPTISGSAAFTSTTRPTSAGTGAPSATSLMTNADVTLAELHYRHAAKNRFISTLLPTTIAGSVGNAANNNGVQLSITLPNTFSAVSFGSTQLHNSFSGAQMSFARPFMASLVFYLRGITDLNAVIRFFVASPNSYLQGVDALSQAGICVEIARSGTNVQARLVYFSGTFKNTSWVNIGVTSDFFVRTNTLVIRNNGTGTFDVFILSTPENVLPGSITKPISNLFGTPTITVSDGPTTAPSANVALISSFGATVADTPTANNTLIVQNFTLEFTS